MTSRLALLLVLAIAALALCNGHTEGDSTKFRCPGAGAWNGNNRPSTLPVCVKQGILCRTGDCADNAPCKATCADGTVLTLTRNGDGTIIVKKGSAVVDVDEGIYKGCNAYCRVPGYATPTVPINRERGTVCGLSHADFCHTPQPSSSDSISKLATGPYCRCIKDKVTFSFNGAPVKDVSLCPGKAHPGTTKYTAKDNCGKTLQVKVRDSKKSPAGGRCGTITRTLTAPCADTHVTKVQKITYEDSVVFSSGCPVKASSKCMGGGVRELTPVVSYHGCVFKAVYKIKDACGIEQTKTVTKL